MTMSAALIAALVCALLVTAAKGEDGVVHLPMTRGEISVTRAFSHTNRPWARAALLQSPQHAHLSGDARGRLLSRKGRLIASPRDPIRRGGSVNGSLPFEELLGGVTTIGEYYVELLFGGQPVRVQIDTGSSTLAVPLKQCFNCRAGDQRFDLTKAKGTTSLVRCDSPACMRNSCHKFSECQICAPNNRACCSQEAPTECGFFLRYADDSSASGALVEADVTLAGFTAPVVFGGILRESPDFEAVVVDGIFGMAYKSLACNPTCVMPLFDTLVDTGKVKRDVFSMCIGERGGTLTLGGVNHNHYHGKLEYVPMGNRGTKQFYDVDIKGLLVGGKKVKVPQLTSGIVDSGTTVLVVTVAAYKAIKKHFQTHYCEVPGLCPPKTEGDVSRTVEVDGLLRKARKPFSKVSHGVEENDSTWFSPVNCMALSDESLKMLPNISMVLEGGVKLEIEPDVYMLQFEVESKSPWSKPFVYRCLGLVPLAGLEHYSNDVIIGDAVLQRYFFTIDREKSRVGFARSKNCVTPKEVLALLEAPSQVPAQSRSWLRAVVLAVPLFLLGIFIAKMLRDKMQRGGYTDISS